MVFSSLLFLYGFFPLSLLACFLCRTQKAKNASLLIFSLLFYAWGEPKYVFLLMFMSLCDWFFALKIETGTSDAADRFWLILACAVNLLLIGIFKYSSMFWSLFAEPPAFIKNIALPIGISFYTFQLLTYVVDVYRGDARAERSYWRVLLYASLFHQCIAGPIVRYKTIADELFVERQSWVELPEGFRRFTVGLAKKAVLANAMGALADTLLLSDAALAEAGAAAANLARLSSLTTLGAWTGAIAYTLQIYLDFSAYSDMAVGMGQMLGLHYPENFNYPYMANSAAEFWRRWHISLSTFFRDYVYIPLGGNRCGKLRTYLNLFIVWSLTGLWHGASWNFVLWGMYYFVLLMIERLGLGKLLKKLPGLSNLYLLLAVIVGWLLFRFTDLRNALAVCRCMFGGASALSDFSSLTVFRNNIFVLLFSILVCFPVFPKLSQYLEAFADGSPAAEKLCGTLKYVIVPVLMLLVSTACLVGDSYNPFIYFRF